jgi:multidrug transporter EmrE-like cation transporter
MLVVYRQGGETRASIFGWGEGSPHKIRALRREMVRWDVLGYGALLALVDVVMMPIAKGVSKKALPVWLMIVPTLVYAADPWIFLQSLKVESMVVMNFVWDLISDILVTFTGLVLLGEKISTMKSIGIGLSFVSLYFLSHESV